MSVALHRVLDPAGGTQVPPGLCALSIMTKAPRAGRVKTRLTPPLTSEEAAALNVCFLRDTGAAIHQACGFALARGIGVYTPVGEEAIYGDIFPADFALIPQREGTFGERLIAATQDLFAVGFASVCLIDSDSPTVLAQTFSEAALALAQPGNRIVFGPSDDGGYYLIGMKELHRSLFEEIDWSTEHVARQTLERAAHLGLDVHMLPDCFDVDDGATLQRLETTLAVLESDSPVAPATRAFLHELRRAERA